MSTPLHVDLSALRRQLAAGEAPTIEDVCALIDDLHRTRQRLGEFLHLADVTRRARGTGDPADAGRLFVV